MGLPLVDGHKAVFNVSAGLGISLLPRSVVERASRHNQVRIHRLAPEDSRAETLFIIRKTGVRSRALDRLIELIAGQKVGGGAKF